MRAVSPTVVVSWHRHGFFAHWNRCRISVCWAIKSKVGRCIRTYSWSRRLPAGPGPVLSDHAGRVWPDRDLAIIRAAHAMSIAEHALVRSITRVHRAAKLPEDHLSTPARGASNV